MKKTDVLINIVVWANTCKSANTNDLNDTVDYRLFHHTVSDWSQTRTYTLVETLAENIASLCLQHPLVYKAQITVEKPHILSQSASAGVTIVREK